MTEENPVCVSATARLTVFLGRERREGSKSSMKMSAGSYCVSSAGYTI